MLREYWHIEEYEKEIIQLWEEGITLREIGESLGFTHKQVQEFKTRYNRKQRKICAGTAIKKKGRPVFALSAQFGAVHLGFPFYFFIHLAFWSA